jgi:hypothetical protein
MGYHEDGSSIFLRNSATNIQSTHNRIQPKKVIVLATTLTEERRLRVFENRVLRIFGPRRDEATGGAEKTK